MAHETAGRSEQVLVDISAPLVAGAEPFGLVRPGQGGVEQRQEPGVVPVTFLVAAPDSPRRGPQGRRRNASCEVREPAAGRRTASSGAARIWTGSTSVSG